MDLVAVVRRLLEILTIGARDPFRLVLLLANLPHEVAEAHALILAEPAQLNALISAAINYVNAIWPDGRALRGRA